MLISSSSNPKYRAALQLRQRRREPQILVDGVRELTYGLDCGLEVDHWFVDVQQQEAEREAIETLTRRIGRSPLHLASHLFEKLSYGERDSQVIAVAARPERSLDELSLSQTPLILVAEGLEKPGNLGAIARTMDAVGADALILADSLVDPFSTNAIRASMGTIFSQRVAIATSEQTCRWLANRNIAIVAAWVDAPRLYVDQDLSGPTAIVVGSEAHGLSQRWQAQQMQQVSLPMSGIADSLNVSTTAAILAYEAWRQRRAARQHSESSSVINS